MQRNSGKKNDLVREEVRIVDSGGHSEDYVTFIPDGEDYAYILHVRRHSECTRLGTNLTLFSVKTVRSALYY